MIISSGYYYYIKLLQQNNNLFHEIKKKHQIRYSSFSRVMIINEFK